MKLSSSPDPTDTKLGWEEMRLNRELESEGLEGMWAGA